MHLPVFWCDGKSSFCIVEFGGRIWDLNKAIGSLPAPNLAFARPSGSLPYHLQAHAAAFFLLYVLYRILLQDPVQSVKRAALRRSSYKPFRSVGHEVRRQAIGGSNETNGSRITSLVFSIRNRWQIGSGNLAKQVNLGTIYRWWFS
jgi:hypothetical protein